MGVGDTKNMLLDRALSYAARGWRVTPCHFVQDGRCSCDKGSNCKSAGKHPRPVAWQKAATTDEDVIAAWWKRWPLANVGIVWGPDSGVIDIEYDGDEGKKNADRLLGDCFTPSYSSGRSVHRLFRWRDGLPEKAVNTVGGMEVRTGAGAKGAQSIAPPSHHYTGITYTWLPGLSPDDVEVMDIPSAMLAVILGDVEQVSAASDDDPLKDNREAAGGERRSARMKLYEQPTVVETIDGRDTVIYAEACAMWRERFLAYGAGVFGDADHQSTIYERLWAWNEAKCRPKLTNDQVQEKCEGGRKFIASEVAKERGANGPNYTALGLERKDGEWFPGQWKLVCVYGEPPDYKLIVPFHPKPIPLTVEEYDNPQLVHLAVQKATGTVCLDDRPGFWTSVWRGTKENKREKIPATRGIRSKLLFAASWEEAKPERRRTAIIAQRLLEVIATAVLIDGEKRKTPNKEGRPSRYPDGAVVFRFTKVWEDMAFSQDKVTRRELSALLQLVGTEDQRIDSDVRFQRLTVESIASLRVVASGLEIGD